MPVEHTCALHTTAIPNLDCVVSQADDKLVVVMLQTVHPPIALNAASNLGVCVIVISPVLFQVLNVPDDAWIKSSKVFVGDAMRW